MQTNKFNKTLTNLDKQPITLKPSSFENYLKFS